MAPEAVRLPAGTVVTVSVIALPPEPAVTASIVTTPSAEVAVTKPANELAGSLIAAAISAAIASTVPPETLKLSEPDVRLPAVPTRLRPLIVTKSPVASGAAFTVTVPEANASAPMIFTQANAT